MKVKRVLKNGYILEGDRHDFFLASDEVTGKPKPGETVEVFVFDRAKGVLEVTTQRPRAVVGDFAALRVKERSRNGMFLFWGIHKDLFVPNSEYEGVLNPGDTAVVRIVADDRLMRVYGTGKIEKYLDTDVSALEVNREVDLLIFEETRLGFKAILDNRWGGLLYRSETFEPVSVGSRLTGYVKQVREDGNVDVALRPQGFKPASRGAREEILEALEAAGGFLPLHDKSDPERISDTVGMSKKLFKAVIGGLYKERKISIDDDGIRLLKHPG
jgi:hypothetical protein